MADAVLLYQDKSATGGLWKAVDTTDGYTGEGGSPDTALSQLAHLIVSRTAAGSTAPARKPAIYAAMLAASNAVSLGNIAADEMFAGSPTFDVTFFPA